MRTITQIFSSRTLLLGPTMSYDEILRKISSPSATPEEILHDLKKAEDALELTSEDDLLLMHRRAKLGVFSAEIVVRRTSGAAVQGAWENILLASVTSVGHWDPGCHGPVLQSYCLKAWLAEAVMRRDLCPNNNLRLQLLRFLEMWSDADFRDYGEKVAKGVVSLGACLRVEHLIPGFYSSLTPPLTNVLQRLQRTGFLGPLGQRARSQLEALQVEEEARWLGVMAELCAQMAEVVGATRIGDERHALMTLMMLDRALRILQILTSSDTVRAAFASPGLAQVVAAVLVRVTRMAVGDVPGFLGADRVCYKDILLKVGKILASFRSAGVPGRHAVLDVLRRDHGSHIAHVAAKLEQVGLSLPDLPTPDADAEDPPYPEEFLDSVTQDLMEAPVRLGSSGMVVDEATLIHLQLVKPLDPFTRRPLAKDTHARLPHLQERLTAWRLERAKRREGRTGEKK